MPTARISRLLMRESNITSESIERDVASAQVLRLESTLFRALVQRRLDAVSIFNLRNQNTNTNYLRYA